ncbi:MAG: DNA translocase FtsK 4TM domain-containing protein [Oligoflexia bacterium]|nr:DNA translocase FtsK 4TM domain-containing protein [Oligoflexia bacterium]
MPTKKNSLNTHSLALDLMGFLFFLFTVVVLLSLLTYTASDPSYFTATGSSTIQNKAGIIGSHLASLLFQTLGLGSFLFSLLLLFSSVACFRRISKQAWFINIPSLFLFLISATACFSLLKPFFLWGGSRIPSGGMLGNLSGGFFRSYLNTPGAVILCLSFLLLSFSLSSKISLRTIFLFSWLGISKLGLMIAGLTIYIFLAVWDFLSRSYESALPILKNRLNEANRIFLQTLKNAIHAIAETFSRKPILIEPEIKQAPIIETTNSTAGSTSMHNELDSSEIEDEESNENRSPSNDPEIIYDSNHENFFDAPEEMQVSHGQKSFAGAGILGFVKKASKDHERTIKNALGKKVNYQIPSMSLLHTPINEESKIDKDELVKQSKLVEEKLADFNVKGAVSAVKPGPVVTMFEFKPAAGVKVNAISNLSDDLALALSAKSIRIVAPIPGRDVVGIEVPNRNRQSVLLKEILVAETFQSKNHSIPIAIGKDILGSPVVADLKKMPHLLVAGTTGSGKSVFINTLICSILYKFNPEELKLILVDPKQLELAPYNHIPHLLLPVVTEPKKASLALQWSVVEMERRYRVIAASGTRDQEGYNKKLQQLGEEKMNALLDKNKLDSNDNLTAEPMPKLVIIIDELADLMMTAKSDVENNICRLAQKARAAGIHLVLATQRPSTDVITGLIKANLPSRICFKVSSKVDSRVMFDAMGAERLIGMGDMLFMPPGDSTLVRMHGAYISVEEVDQITSAWKAQGQPTYREDILIDPEEESMIRGFDEKEANDPLYQQALDVAYTSGAISASYLQRRLRIGYNKAARFVEMMEAQGIVGPADGSKPRPILGPRP